MVVVVVVVVVVERLRLARSDPTTAGASNAGPAAEPPPKTRANATSYNACLVGIEPTTQPLAVWPALWQHEGNMGLTPTH